MPGAGASRWFRRSRRVRPYTPGGYIRKGVSDAARPESGERGRRIRVIGASAGCSRTARWWAGATLRGWDTPGGIPVRVSRPAGTRAVWAMERQVRFAAGSLVLAGLLAGRRRPQARWLSAGVAGGLVLSALTDTCGMAKILAKLPHNQPKAPDLDATLAALAD
ncbi:YgaP family membrane protein [Streptomyces sirii]|uniref:YgaP family membrane protein n=1 Tax=Streptomyces sirii TaxID=3127701 RepID=UPI003D35AEA3